MEKTIHSQAYSIVLRLLRRQREHANLTQSELASKLDETQSFVSKVERGERRLDVIELRAFCSAMGVTLPAFVASLEEELAKAPAEPS
jgi:transcriptional regulator with XRE-family HTH domain